jgi:hypothetical protein
MPEKLCRNFFDFGPVLAQFSGTQIRATSPLPRETTGRESHRFPFSIWENPLFEKSHYQILDTKLTPE